MVGCLKYVGDNKWTIKKFKDKNDWNKYNKFSITAKNYKKIKDTHLPGQFNVRAEDEKSKADVRVQYKSISVGEKLSFPYKIPSGYKKMH